MQQRFTRVYRALEVEVVSLFRAATRCLLLMQHLYDDSKCVLLPQEAAHHSLRNKRSTPSIILCSFHIPAWLFLPDPQGFYCEGTEPCSPIWTSSKPCNSYHHLKEPPQGLSLHSQWVQPWPTFQPSLLGGVLGFRDYPLWCYWCERDAPTAQSARKRRTILLFISCPEGHGAGGGAHLSAEHSLNIDSCSQGPLLQKESK